MTDQRGGGGGDGWDVFGDGPDYGPPPLEDGDSGPQEEPEPEEERIDVEYTSSAPGVCQRRTMSELARVGLYQKAGLLVEVLPRPTGRLAPVPISEAGLACLASDHLRFVSKAKDRDGNWTKRAVAPPKTVMSAVHRAGYWRSVPYLRAITSHPVVRQDGSVRSQSGYDARTQVLSTHEGDLKIDPFSQNGARHAREMLLELVDEFPFVGIGADVWLASVLTPLVRSWCGPSPIFVITSSTPSSGKGRLADLATIISCGGSGVEGGSMPPTDEEWQKCLIAWGLLAPEVIYFDNVASGSRIGSPVLDMALTRDRFSGRILKQSKIVEVELFATWIAAGNNLSAFGDTARRALICRIEPKMERPECREFRIADIIGYARDNREHFLSCALGLLSGWLRTKGPSPTPPLGSFETWSHAVRGAIIWAGGSDVAEALASQVEGADDNAQIHRALLETWREAFGADSATASQVLARCGEKDDLGECEFDEVIAEICPGRGSARYGTARTLSTRLRGIEGRVRDVDGVQLALTRVEGKGPAKWSVIEV